MKRLKAVLVGAILVSGLLLGVAQLRQAHLVASAHLGQPYLIAGGPMEGCDECGVDE